MSGIAIKTHEKYEKGDQVDLGPNPKPQLMVLLELSSVSNTEGSVTILPSIISV